ncbi:kremen protein 1-like isoform X2 [Mercenaria mercenaria]|nr:kremen protein 1-like isoform X2 [Mercenaria mercenaria]XP_053394991.1 kremen protein 1-like isoform X2 [Mercenaria mercenaria]
MKYCPSKFCPPLKLGNGTLLGNMNSVGSRVEYSCNPYFAETVGETNPTCQVNRSWTHYPKCTINFKYLGCYEDRSDRILYGRSMHSSSLTTETCLTFCFESGFKFASTQYGSHCFCGNVLRDYPEKAESECNKPCAGDPTEMCGGTWRGSIYKGI